jgi:hypothetical protein
VPDLHYLSVLSQSLKLNHYSLSRPKKAQATSA